MNNSGTIDELYLAWLYNQIADIRLKSPHGTFWHVARQLYQTSFVWKVYNDDNRAEDGKALRDYFIDECDIQDVEINWLQNDCSMLEMLLALARRSSFESRESTGDWFWKFMQNLNIVISDAEYTAEARAHIRRVIKTFNDRTYKPNGEGGLFPLKHPENDQRQVELWYQLSAYLLEGEYGSLG